LDADNLTHTLADSPTSTTLVARKEQGVDEIKYSMKVPP